MATTLTTKPAGDFTCVCGAEYTKTINRLPMRDTDRAFCDVCGVEIDSWHSTFVPSYELIADPTPRGIVIRTL